MRWGPNIRAKTSAGFLYAIWIIQTDQAIDWMNYGIHSSYLYTSMEYIYINQGPHYVDQSWVRIFIWLPLRTGPNECSVEWGLCSLLYSASKSCNLIELVGIKTEPIFVVLKIIMLFLFGLEKYVEFKNILWHPQFFHRKKDLPSLYKLKS